MPLLKADAEKLLGKKITVTYTQTYTNGRSEKRVETGKLLKVSDHAITISSGTMSFGGFGRVPVESVIDLSKISECK